MSVSGAASIIRSIAVQLGEARSGRRWRGVTPLARCSTSTANSARTSRRRPSLRASHTAWRHDGTGANCVAWPFQAGFGGIWRQEDGE